MTIRQLTDSETELQKFACKLHRKTTIKVYGDMMGRNVDVRIEDDGIQYGHVMTLGARNARGEPHTLGTAITECLELLKADYDIRHG